MQGPDAGFNRTCQFTAAEYPCADFQVIAHFVVLVRMAGVPAQQFVSQLDTSAGFQRSTEIQGLGSGQEFDSENMLYIAQDR